MLLLLLLLGTFGRKTAVSDEISSACQIIISNGGKGGGGGGPVISQHPHTNSSAHGRKNKNRLKAPYQNYKSYHQPKPPPPPSSLTHTLVNFRVQAFEQQRKTHLKTIYITPLFLINAGF
jgi:hypothetical protein